MQDTSSARIAELEAKLDSAIQAIVALTEGCRRIAKLTSANSMGIALSLDIIETAFEGSDVSINSITANSPFFKPFMEADKAISDAGLLPAAEFAAAEPAEPAEPAAPRSPDRAMATALAMEELRTTQPPADDPAANGAPITLPIRQTDESFFTFYQRCIGVILPAYVRNVAAGHYDARLDQSWRMVMSVIRGETDLDVHASDLSRLLSQPDPRLVNWLDLLMLRHSDDSDATTTYLSDGKLGEDLIHILIRLLNEFYVWYEASVSGTN